MKKIAKKLRISLNDFIYKYTLKIDYRFSLKEKELKNDNFECIFFKNNKCIIYHSRPSQCIKFPFWDDFKKKKKEDLDYLQKECIGVSFD